jgi:hypothetical protein
VDLSIYNNSDFDRCAAVEGSALGIRALPVLPKCLALAVQSALENVPANVLVQGNPARVVSTIDRKTTGAS